MAFAMEREAFQGSSSAYKMERKEKGETHLLDILIHVASVAVQIPALAPPPYRPCLLPFI